VKSALACLLLGAGALVLQGSLALLLPPPACPDLGLLVVVALALHWRGELGGLVLAALLGYAADLVSGSLLGEHAFLRLVVYAIARLASRQLNLRGAFPLACFVFAATCAYALGVSALGSLFGAGAPLGLGRAPALAAHAAINAALAPAVSRSVEALLRRAGEDDVRRRPLSVEARRRWA
jgi:rod shape-determining protein MreD